MISKLSGLIVNKKLLFFSASNILLVLIVLRFFCPLYEENDDFYLGLIASGAYGTEFMQYLIYSNIVYGWFLKIFGLIFTGLNWYVVMQYILLTISVISIFYCFSFRFPLHIVACANMLFWYVGFLEQIRRIQFTRTASVVCIAGFVLVWHGISLSAKKATKILGVILCVFGSSIRIDCFWSSAAFFAILFFFLCFSKAGLKKEIFKGYISVFFIIICIVGLFVVVDRACYFLNEDWTSYRKYNAVRGELLDFGIPGGAWKNMTLLALLKMT